MNDVDLIKTITPDIYERILYEQVHLLEHERVGFTGSNNCGKKAASDQVLKWSD